MAELSGGDLVARVLAQAGVGHVFTLCGGHILPIYDGCLREGIRVIDLRHEQAAAHAADASARLTRNLGVAVVTAGPGVTDAVTGVANAYSARSPVLLIGGAAPLGLRGLGALQEMEQVALLRPITKGSWSVAETRQIPETLTTAIRAALSGRPGPVFVEIPVDLLLGQVEDRVAPIPTSYVHRTPAGLAAPALAELARLIGEAERPLVIAGSGVYWDGASAALAAFAERASVPVLMNGAGRGTLPSDHRCAVAAARGFALGQADFVLVLGAPLDFRLGYGRPPTFAENVKVAMIDADPLELGRNRALALGAQVRAAAPGRAVARSGPLRLPRRRSAVRARRQALEPGPARVAHRRRRRIRAQRHGHGDGGALWSADRLRDRQRRRLGPDPQSAAPVLRRRARGRDVVADRPLRSDGRGARRPRRARDQAGRPRPCARARARFGRRVVHQRRARPGGLSPHRPGIHGHLVRHAVLPAIPRPVVMAPR